MEMTLILIASIVIGLAVGLWFRDRKDHILFRGIQKLSLPTLLALLFAMGFDIGSSDAGAELLSSSLFRALPISLVSMGGGVLATVLFLGRKKNQS